MNKMIGVLATTLISAGLSFSALADKVTLKFHTKCVDIYTLQL